MECTPTNKYRCNDCNKIYSSRQSLCNHRTKYHSYQKSPESNLKVTQNMDDSNSIVTQKSSKNIIKQFICSKCDTQFKYKQGKWRHEKKCTVVKDTNLQSENKSLKIKLEQMETKMNEMLAELLKMRKIHPKTLQKINNQLNNNGTINNNIIMKFGNVNINEVLSNKQIMSILHKPFISVEECVKMIHFNDNLPQYNNIYITNMKDDLMYIYDGTKFTTTTKSDAINDLIDNYSDQIEISFDDNKDKMTESKIKCVENYLELINSNKEYIDQYNKKYTNFKTYKVGDVKRLIYDKSDPKKFAVICKGIDV